MVNNLSKIVGKLFGFDSGTNPWQHRIIEAFRENSFEDLHKREILQKIRRILNSNQHIPKKDIAFLDDRHSPAVFHNDIKFLIRGAFIVKKGHGTYGVNKEVCELYCAYVDAKRKALQKLSVTDVLLKTEENQNKGGKTL